MSVAAQSRVPRWLSLLHRAVRFWTLYGNPVHVLRKRFLAPRGRMRIVDRATGLRVECPVAAYGIFGEVFHNREYEVPGVRVVPGDVVLDVGAHRGFFSCLMASRGAQVYAFEPDPESRRDLVHNLDMNGLSGRVRVLPWALSARDGRATLHRSDRMGGGMNTVSEHVVRETNLPLTSTVEVEARGLASSLDDLDVDRVRLCKLDVEGAELDILSALDADRAGRIDAFVMEYHPPAYAVERLVSVLLAWGTHQVSFAEDNAQGPRRILRAVANRVLLGVGPQHDASR